MVWADTNLIVVLKQRPEFFDTKARLSNQGPKRAAAQVAVAGDGENSAALSMVKHDMATFAPSRQRMKPHPLQRADEFAGRKRRKF